MGPGGFPPLSHEKVSKEVDDFALLSPFKSVKTKLGPGGFEPPSHPPQG